MHRLFLEHLSKSYDGRRVVNDVTLEVRSGEVVGLLGPNGAGKTTTFFMVLGLLRPDKGAVTLDGEDISQLPIYQRARKGLQYLPQESSVFRKLTVAENVLAILETLEPDPLVREERLHKLLGELRITHLANQKAANLSGGERRRVEITRALVTAPHFIILGRALRRHRPPGRHRHPEHHPPAEGAGPGGPDLRPQRAGDPVGLRPGLFIEQRGGPGGGHPGTRGQQRSG